MTQAGRALASVANVRSSCPSRGSVRFFRRVNESGITGPRPTAAKEVPSVRHVPQVSPVPLWAKQNVERTRAPPLVPQERTSRIQISADESSLIACDLAGLTRTRAFLYLRAQVIHVPTAARTRGSATPPPRRGTLGYSSFREYLWKNVQTTHILGPRRLQVSPVCCWASPTPVRLPAPTLGTKKKKNVQPPSNPYDFICNSLRKLPPRPISDALAWASQLRRSRRGAWRCVAWRHCGEFHREALSQAQQDVEKSKEWGLRQTRAHGAYTYCTTCLSASLSRSGCVGLLPTSTPRCARAGARGKIFLIFSSQFPAWLPRIGLWSRRNARRCFKCTHSGGSAREVQSAGCDWCRAFPTRVRGHLGITNAKNAFIL